MGNLAAPVMAIETAQMVVMPLTSLREVVLLNVLRSMAACAAELGPLPGTCMCRHNYHHHRAITFTMCETGHFGMTKYQIEDGARHSTRVSCGRVVMGA
jgi:hypothetical protein